MPWSTTISFDEPGTCLPPALRRSTGPAGTAGDEGVRIERPAVDGEVESNLDSVGLEGDDRRTAVDGAGAVFAALAVGLTLGWRPTAGLVASAKDAHAQSNNARREAGDPLSSVTLNDKPRVLRPGNATATVTWNGSANTVFEHGATIFWETTVSKRDFNDEHPPANSRLVISGGAPHETSSKLSAQKLFGSFRSSISPDEMLN